MYSSTHSRSLQAEFVSAIASGNLGALRRLVAQHGTELDLSYEYQGRTTRVEFKGTPLSLAVHLRNDELASFLVRKGANHGYSVESCAARSFTITRSVVPIESATAFEMPQLAKSLMAAGCVDWLEHNYSDDSEAGYTESAPLLHVLLESGSRLRFVESVGMFRGFLGSRFVDVRRENGRVEVTVDGSRQRLEFTSVEQALRWLWTAIAIPELRQAMRISPARDALGGRQEVRGERATAMVRSEAPVL
jgi:hypothetical protein